VRNFGKEKVIKMKKYAVVKMGKSLDRRIKVEKIKEFFIEHEACRRDLQGDV
jgi:hypothetical protein